MVALNMGGFTKLFSRILISSVWSESNETRIVWITLLALTGPDGTAKITLPGLSRLAVIPLPQVEAAVRVLSSPDPYSRTAEHEGRRIREDRDEAGNLVGFFLFNYAAHRAVDSTGAERQRKHRAKRDSNARQKTEDRGQKTKTEERKNEPSDLPGERRPDSHGKANPLIAGRRDEYERLAMTLCREVADLTDQDPVEVMVTAAQYVGAAPGRQKCNPANMSDDRLLNTVSDLRAWLKAEQDKLAKVTA